MIREAIDIRRTLSETPLSRVHDRTLRGVLARRVRPIAWKGFERARYPESALGLANDLWVNLATGEYSSIALFTQIASGLALTAAPFDLVAVATRVSADELRHAEYCMKMAELCSGEEVVLKLDPVALRTEIPVALDQENVDFLLLKYAVVGETLAAALLTECRRRAQDRVAKALFGSLVGDEIGHARFGWYAAAHRTRHWSARERQRLADRLATFVVTIERTFWFGRDAPSGAEAAARALGVLDSETQRGVIADVMEREIIPGLDAIGLGGSQMWALRERGAPRPEA